MALNVCPNALTKGIISDCTTQPVGGIEQRLWIFKRNDHNVVYKSGTSNVIESITNLATKKSYKGTGVQGKTILRCASSLTVAENRANSWVHKFLCDYFEFDSASIAALNGMEDVFIVGERIDKPSNGDGTFFALGVKNGLYYTSGERSFHENNGVLALELNGANEPFEEYTVMAVPGDGQSVYAATLAMLTATEGVPA